MELRRQDKSILIVGLVIIILVILNSQVFFFRADLTENKAYTISAVTQNLIQKLPEPLRLTYYVSGKLRNQMPQIQGISDILYEYSRISNGKVDVRILDTDGKEDQLRPEDYGVQSQQFQVVEKNQVANTLVYTGIVISFLNSTKALPVVTNPASIEYDLTTAIRSLVNKKNPVLGVLAGGNGQDITSKYSMLPLIFQKTAEVRTLNKGEAIPSDIDVLFVFGAEGLGPMDAWNIDQFLMSGKGVLMGQDGMGINLAGDWQATPVNRGILGEMLSSYGVNIEAGWVLDDSCPNIPFNHRQGNMTVQRLVPYPEWIAVTGKGLNQNNPLTSRASGLDLFWASPVSLTEGSSGEVLVSSSANAWLMKDQAIADPQKTLALQRQQHISSPSLFGKPISLAVLRNQQINSFFKGKDLATIVPGKKLQPGINSVAEGRLVVVGDAEFASDLYQSLAQNGLVTNNDNVVFLQNAFEFLSNDTDMMKLRTRQVWDTRLSSIQDPIARDTVSTVALVINAVLVPLILVVFGLVRTIRRKQARNTEV